MKHLMFAIIAVVLVLGLSNTASAQGYVSAGAILTTEVTTGLVMEGLAVDLLAMTQGVCYTITPDGYKNPPTPGEVAAEMTAELDMTTFLISEANPNDFVEVELYLPTTLVGEIGGRINLSDWVYAWNFDGEFATGFVYQAPYTGPFTLEVSIDGEAFIFLGLKACVATGAQAGVYTGQIIAEAHYIVQP